MCPHLSGNKDINSTWVWVLFYNVMCLWEYWIPFFAALNCGLLIENIGLGFHFSYSFGDLAWVISWWLKLEKKKWQGFCQFSLSNLHRKYPHYFMAIFHLGVWEWAESLLKSYPAPQNIENLSKEWEKLQAVNIVSLLISVCFNLHKT